MEGFVDLLEPFFVHMGIDLGGGDVGMTKHFLDDAEVGAAAEEVGGKGMAQEVRVGVEVHGFSASLDDLLEAFGR